MIHETGEQVRLPTPQQPYEFLKSAPVSPTSPHLQAYNREALGESLASHFLQWSHGDEPHLVVMREKRPCEVENLAISPTHSQTGGEKQYPCLHTATDTQLWLNLSHRSIAAFGLLYSSRYIPRPADARVCGRPTSSLSQSGDRG